MCDKMAGFLRFLARNLEKICFSETHFSRAPINAFITLSDKIVYPAL